MTITNPRRSSRQQKTNLWLLLQSNPPLTLVLLMALVVPLLPGPKPSLPWDGASGAAFEVGGLLLLAAALWRADGPGLRRALAFARLGPTPWLIGLGAWGALTAALASGGTAALQGVLHLGTGLLVYTAVAYRVRRDTDFRLVLDVLTAATLLVSVLGIGSLLATGVMGAGSLNHRSFGAVLMLLLPLVVLSAGATGTPMQRGAGQAAVALGLVALLLARWHPAERGALVALLVLGLLCLRLGVRVWPTGGMSFFARVRAARDRRQSAKAAPRHRPGSRSGRRGAMAEKRRLALNRALYSITLFCAAAVFLALTPSGSAILQRVRPALTGAVRSHSFGSASSAHFFRAGSFDRFLQGVSHASSGALRSGKPEGNQSARAMLAMIQAKPLQGWGLGCFAVYQKEWTHQGDDAAAVRRDGPQAVDRSHSAYFQMAAETGLPGLALWALALAFFFVGAGHALRRGEDSPLRRRILIGCLAAVVGQAVEAYSDGSWQFGGVSLFLWLVLGLGVAAAGPGGDAEKGTRGAVLGGTAVARAGWGTQLRFAVLCVLCAVFLALIVRASR